MSFVFTWRRVFSLGGVEHWTPHPMQIIRPGRSTKWLRGTFSTWGQNNNKNTNNWNSRSTRCVKQRYSFSSYGLVVCTSCDIIKNNEEDLSGARIHAKNNVKDSHSSGKKRRINEEQSRPLSCYMHRLYKWAKGGGRHVENELKKTTGEGQFHTEMCLVWKVSKRCNHWANVKKRKKETRTDCGFGDG